MPIPIRRYRVKNGNDDFIASGPAYYDHDDSSDDELDELISPTPKQNVLSLGMNRQPSSTDLEDEARKAGFVDNVFQQAAQWDRSICVPLSDVQATLARLRQDPELSEESLFSYYPLLIIANIFVALVIILSEDSFARTAITNPSSHIWQIALAVIVFIIVVFVELFIFWLVIQAVTSCADGVIKLEVDIDGQRRNTVKQVPEASSLLASFLS